MNKQNSTASGDQPDTVQEMHDISHGVGVYVQFNVVGLDEIDQLIRKHKNLTLELEQNAERMRSVLWGLNVQFRENHQDGRKNKGGDLQQWRKRNTPEDSG